MRARTALMPLPLDIARAIDLAVGERTHGPVLSARIGIRMGRSAPVRTFLRTASRGQGRPAPRCRDETSRG